MSASTVPAPVGGAARHAERLKRVMDAVELRQPDRVPTAFFSTFWIARYGGISYRAGDVRLRPREPSSRGRRCSNCSPTCSRCRTS